MKKCLVYGNCQSMALKGLLKQNPQFNKHYEIVECPSVHLLTQDDLPNQELILSDVDLLIHQPVSDNYKGLYQLSTNYLKSKLKPKAKVISFPVAYFTGYNPEMVYLKTKNGQRIAQPFTYHDTNIMKFYLLGKSVNETIELIQSNDFYQSSYAHQNLENTLFNLEQRERDLDIKLSSFIRESYKVDKLFYTFNHPTSIILNYLANSIFQALELDKNKVFFDILEKSDILANSSFPIYPSLYSALELQFPTSNSYVFERKTYPMESVVDSYFKIYDNHRDTVIEFCENTLSYIDQTLKLTNTSVAHNRIAQISDPINLQPYTMTLTKVEGIFKQLEKTRLFKKLSKENPILFVGDKETLNTLEKSLSSQVKTSPHEYKIWDDIFQEDLNFYENFHTDLSVIVASIQNENFIYNEIKQKTKGKIPILRLLTDVFVSAIADRPLLDPIEENFQQPNLSYAILTTPRSGSTYLCELLKNTKLAGYPAEHIRLINSVLTENCGFENIRFLNVLMQNKVTENKVFGTKFISHFLLDLQSIEPRFDEIIKNQFSKYIYLIRQDKVSQAISTILAQRTKKWHIFTHKERKEYEDNIQALEINDALLEEVFKLYHSLVNQEKRLEQLLEKYQIEPLVIKYEDFVKNPLENMNSLFKYLGIYIEEEYLYQIPSKSEKLKSSVSLSIAEKFHKKYFLQ